VISSVLLLDMFQMDVQGRLVLELRRRSDFPNDAFNILSHRRCLREGVGCSMVYTDSLLGQSMPTVIAKVPCSFLSSPVRHTISL
jgi:hypothetical protein